MGSFVFNPSTKLAPKLSSRPRRVSYSRRLISSEVCLEHTATAIVTRSNPSLLRWLLFLNGLFRNLVSSGIIYAIKRRRRVIVALVFPSLFYAPSRLCLYHVGRDIWAQINLALHSALRGDKGVVPSRQDKSHGDGDENHVGSSKTKNVKGVVTELVEGRVREAVDDGENGGGHVADQRAPKRRDGPVFALSDDFVQVTAQLISL